MIFFFQHIEDTVKEIKLVMGGWLGNYSAMKKKFLPRYRFIRVLNMEILQFSKCSKTLKIAGNFLFTVQEIENL